MGFRRSLLWMIATVLCTLFIDSAPRLGAHLAANAQTLWTIDTSLVTGPAKN